MKEKNFFLSIKKQLPKGCFIQKIENKFNSGFVDLILITEKNPLFIELKTTKKGNRVNVELSQISIHLRIFANNYVSFFLVHDPLSSNLFLFHGGKLCNYLVKNGLCTLIVSKKIESINLRFVKCAKGCIKKLYEILSATLCTFRIENKNIHKKNSQLKVGYYKS